ncbi:MAG: FecR family protein [Paludibacter sp.]|nr:FecR family protein [Paludibacter sp.]MDD4427198.1 FecR family protein [Paludibacter sp.]
MTQNKINLIKKFLSNDISSDEMYELRQWYNEKGLSETLFSEYYRRQWQEALENPADSANESCLRVWNKLHKQLDKDSRSIKTLNHTSLKVVRISAVVVLCILLGFGLNWKTSRMPREDLIVRVENGQKAHVQLPDGSSVWLNSASEIRYSPDFGKKNRTVKLTGEAYFEVESNPDNPFIVQTGNDLEIKALGTKFNIKSYSNDKQITGTLLEGKIDVSNSSFSEMLQPNERIVFDTSNNTFRKSYIQSSDEAIFWLTDQFVFDGETLENIAMILERMYNVKFTFASPDLKTIQYSGKINNNSMENVLNLITTVSPLHYTINDSIITFSKKKMK